VHLKDVRADIAATVRDGDTGYTAAVRQRMYVPLGEGDVDVSAVITSLRDAGYTGWYVLEQDTALGDDSPLDTPVRDTGRSLAHLTRFTA
jgi:inosose dehydratase